MQKDTQLDQARNINLLRTFGMQCNLFETTNDCVCFHIPQEYSPCMHYTAAENISAAARGILKEINSHREPINEFFFAPILTKS